MICGKNSLTLLLFILVIGFLISCNEEKKNESRPVSPPRIPKKIIKKTAITSTATASKVRRTIQKKFKTIFGGKSLRRIAKPWMTDHLDGRPKLKEWDIIKNPSRYRGSRTYYKGTVIQIREKGEIGNCGGWFLLGRCRLGSGIPYWMCPYRFKGDPIYISYWGCDGSPSKRQKVTVYGTVMGTYRYKAVSGNLKEVARLHAKYVVK